MTPDEMIEFQEGMQLEEGDEVVEIAPEYDKELYENLKLPAPAPKKMVKKSKKPAADPPAPVPAKTELTEEEEERIAIAALKKRGILGEGIDKLEHLKPAGSQESEEEKKKREERDKLAFALQNEIITPEQIRQYHTDMAKQDRELVWEDYLNKHKNSGKTMEQLEASFQKLWLENDDSPENADVREERVAEMKELAEKIRRKRNKSVFEIDSKYNAHVSEQKKLHEQHTQTINTAKIYRADLDNIFTEIRGEVYKVGSEKDEDIEDISFEYPSDVIDEVKKYFLDVNTLGRFIANYSKDSLKEAIHNALRLKTEAQRISHVAKKYHSSKMEKIRTKRKNLNPDDIPGGSDIEPKDDEMYERLKEHLPEEGV